VWHNDDFSIARRKVTRLDFVIGTEDKRMLELVPAYCRSINHVGERPVRSVQRRWRRQLAASCAEGPSTEQRSGSFAQREGTHGGPVQDVGPSFVGPQAAHEQQTTRRRRPT
jgi:hypothetical protein